MTGDPKTLLAHTVFGSPHRDASELREAIEARLPGIDLAAARTPPETRDGIETAEVVVTSRLDAELVEHAENLRWVQALSSGVDSYPRDRLRDEGIALTNAAGVHAEPIAEQVLGYMLAFERGIHRGIAQQSRGTWEWYPGGELRGKTLGVVGVGAIGGRVAEFGTALGMEVLGVKRDPESAPDAVDEAFRPDEIYEVLPRTEYLVIAVPLTDETRGMIGREELATLPSDAVLVNIARGEVVDQDALVGALQGRRIRGAALDVFSEEPLPADSPLWDLSNVIATPHMAGYSPHNVGRVADVFAENYRAYVDGRADEMPTRVL